MPEETIPECFEEALNKEFKSNNPLLEKEDSPVELIADLDTKDMWKELGLDEDWLLKEASIVGMKGIFKMVTEDKRPLKVFSEYIPNMTIREFYIALTFHHFMESVSMSKGQAHDLRFIMMKSKSQYRSYTFMLSFQQKTIFGNHI